MPFRRCLERPKGELFCKGTPPNPPLPFSTHAHRHICVMAVPTTLAIRCRSKDDEVGNLLEISPPVLNLVQSCKSK